MKRSDLRACQCGARPAWRLAERQPAGRRSARAEVLACPLCGNSTEPTASRERLAGEWNSAGWCGQAVTAADADAPFGPRWQAQCMRMSKAELAGVYALACQQMEGMRRRQRSDEELIARLRVKRTRRELAAVIDRLVQRGIVAKADAAGAKRRVMEG